MTFSHILPPPMDFLDPPLIIILMMIITIIILIGYRARNLTEILS